MNGTLDAHRSKTNFTYEQPIFLSPELSQYITPHPAMIRLQTHRDNLI